MDATVLGSPKLLDYMTWKFRYIPFDSTVIFGHNEHVVGYCKSPQVLHLGDRIRVYFCVASKDGKYLKSKPAFCEFDKNFDTLISVSDLKIIEDSQLGSFDEHGIFPFSPLALENNFYAFTTGWSRRISVDIELSVGLVESFDGGKTFHRSFGSGPVLGATPEEPFLIGDAFVRRFNEKFHMWYIYGLNWANDSHGIPQRKYRIAHATSNDLISWQRQSGFCLPNEQSNVCEALPSVCWYKNQYHLVYCARDQFDFRSTDKSNKNYRLRHAVSDDLENWKVMKNSFLMSYGDFDRQMQCYPHIFVSNGGLKVIYNGSGFGKSGFGLLEWSK